MEKTAYLQRGSRRRLRNYGPHPRVAHRYTYFVLVWPVRIDVREEEEGPESRNVKYWKRFV